ncbi:FadR/GntR family transcriptional regulator [Neptunomonas qingdaonensis]|uniref:DNA-binding transcriptional regulator, FadR family n=1 Tax=Neptunomonas qingdaonensis TaxID=1045558 RepID=A0A1I2UIX8_9GAMM|nr:FadR/GntR family transcriptional regulator [Neptunomonas qingdaonensis]SFG76299.1 DNA-binding transcriptional regulator, FadR family [Neptunomonas qingdaonensis]
MKSIDFEPVSQQSLSRQIADQIRQSIIDGSLAADDRLPTEDELAIRFKVSRPTIREALKRLAAQNLVRSKRGPTGGTFVNRPSISDLSDSLAGATTLLMGLNAFSLEEITQTRLELESICCRLAAQNRSAEDLDAMLLELRTQADPSISAEEFCASDVNFHRLIANATGNRMLGFVMHTVIEALQPVANMVAHRYRQKEVIHSQHERLFAAISSQDCVLATQILSEQVLYLSEQHHAAQQNKQSS